MSESVNLNSVVARNSTLIASEVDGELVMMSMMAGQYYGLDTIGTRIWQLLESECSVQELCGRLTGEFAVSADECAKDVLAFLHELQRHDIVIVREPA